MNQEQSIKSRAVPGGNQIRVRLDQFKQSRGLGQVGAAELAGMAAAVLLLLVTVFVYFYLLLPARARRDSAQLDRQRLQGQLRAAQGEVVLNTNTKETVDKINASLEDFEGNDLAPTSSGRMSLYAELNNLIRSNGLRDTAGPTYTTLDPIGTKPQSQVLAGAEKQASAKWQSVYPGIAVSVTVEGPYQNVRRFVRDLEISRQFLIINAVELESVTPSGAAPELAAAETPASRVPPGTSVRGRAAGPGVEPAAGARGSLVSLRLDLTTYFQRESGRGIPNPRVPAR